MVQEPLALSMGSKEKKWSEIKLFFLIMLLDLFW